MTVIVPSEGRRRDLPMLEGAQVASAAAGSAADVSTIIAALTDLTLTDLPNNLNEKMQGDLPINASRLRQALWVNNAANRAGNATNFYDFRVYNYRKGKLQGTLFYDSQQVSTTVAIAVTVIGVQAVTPAAMTGIVPGSALYVDSAGTPELVYVISTTSTTFTANFTLTHSASFTVTSEHLQNWGIAFNPAKAIAAGATIPAIGSTGSQAVTPNAVNGLSGMYGIHVNDWILVTDGASTETVQVTAVSATQFTATFANTHGSGVGISTTGNPNYLGSSGGTFGSGGGDAFEIKGGDVLVLTRVSNNATGLASDAGLIQYDWVPSRVAR